MVKWSVLLLVTLVIATDGALASTRFWEGSPPLALDLSTSDHSDSAGQWTLGVSKWVAGIPAGAVAIVSLEISSNAEVVEGQSSLMGPASDASVRHLTLRRAGPGNVRIVGSMRVPSDEPGSYYHYVELLQVGFEGNRLITIEKKPLQRFVSRRGQRFRYGGQFLVPLDTSESADEPTILSRPKLLTTAEIVCAECELTETTVISTILTIGRDGGVTSARPTSPPAPGREERLWATVHRGLRTWRFTPAMCSAGPVSDYVVLPIRVLGR